MNTIPARPNPIRGKCGPLNKDSLPMTVLTDSMVRRRSITIIDHATGVRHTGIVNEIAVEDGSGVRYRVTLHTGMQLYHMISL